MKTKKKTAAPPVSVDKPVVLTVSIFPLKNGKRPLVISGAPDGEMPVVRSGNFSEIHSLFDELWLELIKRKPKIVTKPAAAKGKATLSDESDETEPTEATAEGDEAEPAQATPEAVAELEDSICQAKSNTEDASDQLVTSVGEGDDAPEQLPLIEGDPTAE